MTLSGYPGKSLAKENCSEKPAISSTFLGLLVLVRAVQESTFRFHVYRRRENGRPRPDARSLSTVACGLLFEAVIAATAKFERYDSPRSRRSGGISQWSSVDGQVGIEFPSLEAGTIYVDAMVV